jgi:hypothetical protein
MSTTHTKKGFLGVAAGLLLLLGTCVIAMRACQQDKSGHLTLMPVRADIVFYRNYRIPTFDFRYSRLDRKYDLGKAVVIPPSKAWLELAAQLGITRDVSEFPLAFAHPRRSKGGRELLVVVQLEHKLSGDGFFSGPSPVMYMEMVTVEGHGTATPKVVWTGSTSLGTMQGSCLYAGEADATDASKAIFKIETESGYRKAVVMELLDDGSLRVIHKP